MKCPSCGGQLSFNSNTFHCEYCNSSFLKEELMQKTKINNSNFVVKGGVVIGYHGFDKAIIIPDGVSAIGPNAFINNLNITKVVFSDSVVSIEKGAFQGCSNLLEITNYQNIQYFKDECFQFSGLKEIEINENVLSIGKNAFSDISHLVKVNYHPGKNLSLDKTFARCSNLVEVITDQKYFFPFFCRRIEIRNNSGVDRPTYGDAFSGTKYYQITKQKFNELYKQNICPDCGGHIKKSLLHAKCERCGIDYKAVVF